MANTIIPKRSSVAGKVPATTDLVVGEIAVNLTDKKLFVKDASGAVVELGGGGTAGGNDLPLGGTTGQVLAKKSPANYDVEWVDASTGNAGGSGAYVVSDPIFTMQSQVLSGQTLKVSAYAQSLLNGVDIDTITFVLPTGSVTVPATQGAANTNMLAAGVEGSVIAISAFATDVLGNASRTASYQVVISANFVNKAAITSPFDGTSMVENGLVITTTDFLTSGATDTFSLAEFEARTEPLGAGAVLWSGTFPSGGPSIISIRVPDDVIPAGTTVYLRARHAGSTLGYGQWSDDVQVTTAPVLTPSTIGDPYQGGFYAGRITLNGQLYALVVAPRSTESTQQFCNSSTANLTTQAKSLIDGYGNTIDLINNGSTIWPAAKYCYDLAVGGYTDWYLPSILELELLYRVFKPSETANVTTAVTATDVGGGSVWSGGMYGLQTYSTPAAAAYTNSGVQATNPSMTSVQAFQGSGVQEGFSSVPYWSSSAPGSSVSARENGTYLQFNDGRAFGSGSATGDTLYTTTTRRVRAVRRVYLRAA